MEDKRISLSQRSVRAGLAVLTSLLLVGGIAWREGFAAPEKADSPAVAAIEQSSSAARSVAGAHDSYADVVKIVAPSVVTIRTEGRARMAPTGFPGGDDQEELFRRFFGGQFQQRGERPPMRQAPRQRGLGSGVIVSSDGYILTNHHVIDNADRILVDLTDGRSVTGKLVGSDEPSDLAVVKVEADNLHPLTLGDSESVQVGDVVLAVGNPLGLGQTVTMGIISAKGRQTDTEGYEDFLQTDAPINHGNSGGALVNTKGELIGINSQIASVSDGNIGIGFAIPANMAKRVMADLKSGGRVRRGQLGIGIQGVTSDLADSLGLKQVGGSIVTSVTPGSAADKAGIKREDVIVSFNGKPVADSNALRNRVAETAPGTTVNVGIIRDGKEQTLSVKLDELPADKSASNSQPTERDQNALGVRVSPLTPELAERADVPKGVQGLLVESVSPDSRAAEAGLRSGDVIQQVNRQPVRSVDDLRAAVQRTTDRPALMLVSREGRDIYLTVRPS
ncbi:MAG TPA: DegQ family serine endoprotease [Vicinamibacterales bacterium]|jgi:Do/DeqQ family serine protease|nr:DegQ family serine endoprotease [Vicinamibacterales bacterium]